MRSLPPAAPAPGAPGGHGVDVPRGSAKAADAARSGGFGRMFPQLQPAPTGDDVIAALDDLLAGRRRLGLNSLLPAGFTYLGQFVDHDLTFDPSSLAQRASDPAATVNFRTPRLDLDSLYGTGPSDAPYLYDWEGAGAGLKLLLDTTADGVLDLPRNRQQRALIGDPRNDEHLIVAQLHLLFIRFHNRVVDDLLAAGDERTFERARELVRWHYQWVVLHDYLPRLVGHELLADVRERRVARQLTWRGQPFIPIEFSAAAYRFGHSAVRDSYRMNDAADEPSIVAGGPQAPATSHLGGHRRLPAQLVIDWSRFFDLGRRAPQPSSMIDASIANGLRRLPGSPTSLPRRNLERGRLVELPSGQAVAGALGHPSGHLSDTQLLLDELTDAGVRDAVAHSAPLWFFLLCEAAAGGGLRLGPVGGRIVAETIVGLVEADPSSHLHAASAWRPTLPAAVPGTFSMADLVRFAESPPPAGGAAAGG